MHVDAHPDLPFTGVYTTDIWEENQICLCSNGLITQHGLSSQGSLFITIETVPLYLWQCSPLTSAEASFVPLLVTGTYS